MSNETAADLHQVEVTIEEARKSIDKRDSMMRLLNNRDFKKLILVDLFEKEPARLVTLKCHPAQQEPESQAYIDKQMQMIGMLQQHLNYIRIQGNMLDRDLAEHEATQEALLAEMLVEGDE